MKSLIFSVTVVCFSVCLSISFSTLAATRYVDGSVSASGDGTSWNTAFKKIQEGIGAASEGDTVIVAEGTHVENIKFNGKNITLTSKDPSQAEVVAKTIIDGDQAGSVVSFSGKENETCILTGFTIRNGKAEYGGGIFGRESHYVPTLSNIENNVIVDNFATYGGGLSHCGGIIRNNTIASNSAEWWGGGVDRCDGPIQNNKIIQNLAQYGGGLHQCRGAVENNEISQNSADSGGGLAECPGAIRGNDISGNSAQFEGGGLRRCEATLQNNTIRANSAREGGGISNCGGTIENNTIVRNSADYGGGLHSCQGTIRNCIVWGNTAAHGPQLFGCAKPTYSCVEDWAGSGEGNIAWNPYFVNAEKGNLHLLSLSPCIDTGDPASPYLKELEPNGGRVNMGAYGNSPEAASRSPDTDADGLPDEWEMEQFGHTEHVAESDPDGDRIFNLTEYRYAWDPVGKASTLVENLTKVKFYQSIQAALCESHDGDEIAVHPGLYMENVSFDARNVVLRSTDPKDPDIVAQTIIDGGGKGPAVSFLGTETGRCILAGFTIRNGWGFNGGGVCGGTFQDHSRAAIRNCVITSNTAKYNGGGIAYLDGLIEQNKIADNTAHDQGGGSSDCNGLMRSNRISGNYRGGLCRCGGQIQNNVIFGNRSDVNGGALCDCDGIIENNTIFGNSAIGTPGTGTYKSGGGLYGCNGVIRNCILWGNTASGAGSQLWDSSIPSFSCVQDWTEGGAGNIVAYPHFADVASGNFHLRSWSPCIDSGDPASPFSMEPEPNGGRIDMGAYGNTPEATSKSPDTDADGLPDEWELLYFADLQEDGNGDPDGDDIPTSEEFRQGRDPTSAAETDIVVNLTRGISYLVIQVALSESNDGDEIIVYPGTYEENLDFAGTNAILRSVDPLQSSVVSSTVIDGRQRGPVVKFSGTELESCVLAGFTIRNGMDTYGGGVHGGSAQSRSRATIRLNVIADNSGPGLSYCDGTIRNNIVLRNSSSYSGGGLAYCDGIIENNTLVDNSSYYAGRALAYCHGPIRNCIIWGPPGSQQLLDCATPTYSCIEGWNAGGEGNLSFYPYFVDPDNGDYHLRSWSPCIDAGDPASPFSMEPEPNGARIDMGAHGNTPESTSASEDTDADGLPDDWEMEFFGFLVLAAEDDADGDQISNMEEYRRGLNPADVLAWVYVHASVSASGDGTSWKTAFKTIQEGIEAASEGQVVIVAPGIYEERAHFKGKNIILRSTRPLDPDVVAATVVRSAAFYGTEDGNCVLSGFTIRRGPGIRGGTEDARSHASIECNVITECEVAGGSGAGIIYCDGIIRNNIIRGNLATEAGGGIAYCDGLIENNVIAENRGGYFGGGGLAYCNGIIQNNTVSDNLADNGGGLYRCNGTIRKNVIVRNSTNSSWEGNGGGLAYCDGLIENNVISDNSAFGAPEGDGGGLFFCGGNIRNNTITGNLTDRGRGGGLANCNGVIENNIISCNSALATTGGHGDGGGLASCQAIIRNNVIFGNSARWGGGGLYGCAGTIQSNTIYGNTSRWSGGGLSDCGGETKDCIIWGNWATHDRQLYMSNLPTYSCIEHWTGGGEGNIRLNPYFAAVDEGNLHLKSWSPCIDSGDPSSPFSNEPEPNGGRVNMGAYGNTPEATSKSPDADADGLPDHWEQFSFGGLIQNPDGDPDSDRIDNITDYHFGWDPTAAGSTRVENLSKARFYQTVQVAISESENGDEIVVYPGLYAENICFDGRKVVLRSTDPFSPELVGRTIIDGRGVGPAVTFSGTEDQTCVLSGFAIRNGTAEYGGGGILGGTSDGSRTQATIKNNSIFSNFAKYGAGLYLCDGLIESNTIHGNSADWEGGGLYTCVGVIRNNAIYGNFAGKNGAGLSECGGEIRGNMIFGNFADEKGGGLFNCYGRMLQNRVYENSADYGGGLAECNGRLQNNLIYGNVAEQYGGGLHSCSGPIDSNAIYGNTSGGRGGGLSECSGMIWNCILWGNLAQEGNQLHDSTVPTYSCIQDWALGGEGNIALDPRFVSPESGDLHLLPGSPCIDAGTITGSPDHDIDVEIRPHGMAVDIGADECVDTDSDGMPDYWELKYFGGPSHDGMDDTDSDGLTDVQECSLGTNPTNADTDGDGRSDGDEFIAGTCPTDAQSLFRVTVLAYDRKAGARLQWTVVPGKRYQVYVSTELPAWAPFGSPYLASPGQSLMTITDRTAWGFQKGFYKVQVLP